MKRKVNWISSKGFYVEPLDATANEAISRMVAQTSDDVVEHSDKCGEIHNLYQVNLVQFQQLARSRFSSNFSCSFWLKNGRDQISSFEIPIDDLRLNPSSTMTAE
jgi:hypothetical protein